MGEPMTRIYRKGVLEAAGYPLADISEYLGDPDAVVGRPFQLGHRIDRLDVQPGAVGVVIGR